MFFEEQKRINRKYKFAIIIAISISEFIINDCSIKIMIEHLNLKS